MNKVLIVQKDNKVLRQKAKHVPLKDIKSKRIVELIKSMKKSLEAEDDGVGLAAPQIGENLKIFIISKKIFPEKYPDGLVFINPEIVKLSKEKEWTEEGCLSVRPWFGRVKRSIKATIRAFDEEGQEILMGATGLLAQIFQHEIDHLNGILFTDKAKDLIEVKEEEVSNKI